MIFNEFVRGKFALLMSIYKTEGFFITLRKGFAHIFTLLHVWGHIVFWNIYAMALNKRLVHFIGDSHVRVFNLENGIITYAISSATAHNLIKEDSSTHSRQLMHKYLKCVNRKRDIVVMVFGEVDCRFHFYYQYVSHKGERPVEEFIDRTLLNYGAVLKEISNNGFFVCVCGVAPACIEGNVTAYPYYGTSSVRADITKLFNEKLKYLCTGNNMPFIDMYTPAADRDGLRKKEYDTDGIHLNKKIIPHVRMQLNMLFKNGVFG